MQKLAKATLVCLNYANKDKNNRLEKLLSMAFLISGT